MQKKTADRPSDRILAGEEELRSVEGIIVLEDWTPLPTTLGGIAKGWMLKCEIKIKSANTEVVAHKTNWCIGVDERYPNGEIELVPAKVGGITKTFQHQYYNGGGAAGIPWRDGVICVKGSMSYLKVRGYDSEPFEEKDRLKWHVELVKRWLEDASNGSLVGEGELFELPHYAPLDKKTRLIFCESWESLHVWEGLDGQYGTVELGLVNRVRKNYMTLEYKTKNGRHLHTTPWSKEWVKRIDGKEVGGWVLLKQPLFLEPWQAPMIWEELMEALMIQGIDGENVMRGVCELLGRRDQAIVLLGLPISRWIGEKERQIHWQAFRLHGLESNFGSWTMRWWRIATQKARFEWIKSENWDETAIRNRGRFGERLRDKRIVIVGVGSLGSMIAEILTRGGVKDITIVDHDCIEVGNLCRHTLLLESIDHLKVKALGDRIVGISPHVNVNEINAKIEDVPSAQWKYIVKGDIILNCTANDDVISFFEEQVFDDVKIFGSLAISLGPKRLYVLVGTKKRYPGRFYKRHIDKWLDKDVREYEGEGLPRSGGIGCWHPAFPARSDDMWLFAVSGIKYLESYLRSGKKDAVLAVFELRQGEGGFTGIELVAEEWDNG